MPLRSVSGSEASAYIDFGQLADSALNLGIAEYFQGMAIVESVDPRKPDEDRLREAGGHLATARTHIARSADAGRRMMEHVPAASKEAGDFFRMRLASTMKMTQALDSVIGKVHADLSGGKYPAMAGCAEAASAFIDIFGRFRENAQFHAQEGF